MTYTYKTSFSGEFAISKRLAAAHLLYLRSFCAIRHCAMRPGVSAMPDPLRKVVGLPAGPEGMFYVGPQPVLSSWTT